MNQLVQDRCVSQIKRVLGFSFLLLGVAHVPRIPHSPALHMGDRIGLYGSIKWEKADPAKPSEGTVGKICSGKLEMLEGKCSNLGIRGNLSS